MILPHFDYAMENIQRLVRDGAKHQAAGMLNTSWKDTGEELRGPAWHGYAWGAECAWNAATTEPKDFNRRIGAVLFGEKGDHFGQAIELLVQAYKLPITKPESNYPPWCERMLLTRFWQNDFAPKVNEATAHTLADPFLALVHPAIKHLEACKNEATANADLLDSFVFGAKRMELIGQRMLDGVDAARAYTEATKAAEKDEKLAKLAKAEQFVCRNRDACKALGDEHTRLWHTESKPYALDRVITQYAGMVKCYDDLRAKLADARKQVEAGKPLPAPAQLGLALP